MAACLSTPKPQFYSIAVDGAADDGKTGDGLHLIGLWTPGKSTLPLRMLGSGEFPSQRYRLSPIPEIEGAKTSKNGEGGFALRSGGFVAGWSVP